MKLRIQGNSLRLRLTQTEVGQLLDSRRVQSSIEFAQGRTLTYSIEASENAPRVAACFDDDNIRVILPEVMMRSWAEGLDVGIEALAGPGPRVLVEKDFRCLHLSAEENADAYPHPLA